MQKDNPWTTLEGETKYDNNWIRVREDNVITPAGKPGIYGVVHFKSIAVAIIPLDDDNNTWIVGQFRYPTQTYEWEIVEGGCPIGSSPEATAHRELLEECGIQAKVMIPILEMQLSNSATDEVSVSYVARHLSFTKSEPEETEMLEVKKISFDELFEMVLRGEIKDGLSVASIFKCKWMLDRGLI